MAYLVLFLFYKGVITMKVKVEKDYCKHCVWQQNGLCMFQRCVKGYGFVADKPIKKGDK